MHDRSLALARTQWTTREMATWRIHAQTIATATQDSLPQRASSTQCRRADPRAARGGREWLEKQPAHHAQHVAQRVEAEDT